MHLFQIALAVLFIGSLAVVYSAQILKALRAVLGQVVVASKHDSPAVKPSIAIGLVDDIIALTALRDRLTAEGCTEGVEACTTLLRVIVEYKQPVKGVV
jgi:hypothetical protein